MGQYSVALDKPLPTVIPETAGFWEGTRAEELRVQACRACGHRQINASPVCDECLSPDLEWQKASGRGRVFSYTVVHHAFHPAFAAETPYVVADIELDEGPVLTSNVTGIAPDRVRIDMPVEVWFHKVNDEITLPKFKPRNGHT